MKIRRDKILDLMSLYFRVKANGICQKCGKFVGYDRLSLCHGVGRRKLSTRYDPDNLAVLCAGCHMEIDQNVFAKTELFLKLIGAERWAFLKVKSEMVKVKIDKEALMEEYKNKLRRLE